MSAQRQILTTITVLIFFLAGFLKGTTWVITYEGQTNFDIPRITSLILFVLGLLFLFVVLFATTDKKQNELEKDIEKIGTKD